MKEIYHCLWIEAELNKVYWALTDISGLSGWWTRSVEGTGSVDSISTFRFESGAFNKMKIKSLVQDKVEWECVDGHEEWKGTKITFELDFVVDKTKLCFSHFGWKRQSEYTGECSYLWANYLLSLKKFCETGHGMPNNGV